TCGARLLDLKRRITRVAPAAAAIPRASRIAFFMKSPPSQFRAPLGCAKRFRGCRSISAAHKLCRDCAEEYIPVAWFRRAETQDPSTPLRYARDDRAVVICARDDRAVVVPRLRSLSSG